MSRPRVFFAHVMKTGGTTVTLQLIREFPPDRRHPPDDSSWMQKVLTEEHLALSPEELEKIDLFVSHVAAATVDALGFEGARITLVRHPLDRAVSHLRQSVDVARMATGTDITPEQIYEQPLVREWTLVNHQVRAFSLGTDELLDWDRAMFAQLASPWWCTDPPDADLHPIRMDEHRLARAKETLDRFDVVGVTDRLDLFAEQLQDATGYQVRGDITTNPGSDTEISPELRQRLAEDNELEIELYEHARRLAGASD